MGEFDLKLLSEIGIYIMKYYSIWCAVVYNRKSLEYDINDAEFYDGIRSGVMRIYETQYR